MRTLGSLAPAASRAAVAPTDARLQDAEAQLARLERSLAEAATAGNTALVGRLAILRHAQQERLADVRGEVAERASDGSLGARIMEPLMEVGEAEEGAGRGAVVQ